MEIRYMMCYTYLGEITIQNHIMRRIRALTNMIGQLAIENEMNREQIVVIRSMTTFLSQLFHTRTQV